MDSLKLSVLGNLSLCCLQLGEYKEAVDHCNKVWCDAGQAGPGQAQGRSRACMQLSCLRTCVCGIGSVCSPV